MQSPELESRRVFLVAANDSKMSAQVTRIIQEHIKQTTIFTAVDGQDALFKVDNVLPHVAIVDVNLSKLDGFTVTDKLIHLYREHSISVILVSDLPDKEHFVDEVVTGQVQFITKKEIEQKLPVAIARALNRISLEDSSTYRLHFLAAKEVLFNEGDPAGSVFITKTGELEAVKKDEGQGVVLGRIKPGEFVGEMAHINNDMRSATVRAISDCELIEIPRGTLDLVLFSKPAWAKALIATLSRRLKMSNSLMMNKASAKSEA